MTEALSKAAVTQFLEAAKSSLQYLGELKLRICGNRQARVDDKEVLNLYSRLRRVREYLRRWLSAYPTPTELDLPDEELELLCSCMVFEIDRLSGPDGRREDINLAQKRVEMLSEWAVRLSTKPITLLPNESGRVEIGAQARTVVAAARKNAFPSAGSDGAPSGLQRHTAVTSGANHRRPSSARAVPSSVVPGAGLPLEDEAAQPSAGPAPRRAGPAVVRDQDVVVTGLLDPTRIRDYRLRLAMSLDLKALERATRNGDYRIGTVLLACVLEGLSIDHALANKESLGLIGDPPSWSIPRIVETVLQGDVSDKERILIDLLGRSHGMLRPAQQIAHPMVVNRATVAAGVTLVKRVAHAIGCVAEAEPSNGWTGAQIL